MYWSVTPGQYCSDLVCLFQLVQPGAFPELIPAGRARGRSRGQSPADASLQKPAQVRVSFTRTCIPAVVSRYRKSCIIIQVTPHIREG